MKCKNDKSHRELGLCKFLHSKLTNLKKRFIEVCKSFPIIILIKKLAKIVFAFHSYLNHFITELLEPLDRGDMLNEAFIGLSLTPQGGDPFPDNFSPFCSIYRHIIQQRTVNISSKR